jgi:hypothetical protein
VAKTRKQYKAAIATALTAHLRAQMTDVSVVKFDPFWDRPATLAKLEARLPAICIRYAGGEADDEVDAPASDGALSWSTNWSVVYLGKLDPDNDFAYEEVLDELEGLFEQEDYPLPGFTAVDGLVIKYCRPDSDSTFDDLIDKGIGGVFLSLAIGYAVFPTVDP